VKDIDRDNWSGKARSDDPETSHENARAQTPEKIRAVHLEAIAAMKLRGGAATAPQVLPLNQQTRMEEMRRNGLVRRTEIKVKRAYVHELTTAGWQL
jgi:hypothetical protein